MIGYIQDYDYEQKLLTVIVPDFHDIDALEYQAIHECEVILKDGRSITPEQRRKIFCMVRDITEYISGYAEKRHVINETLCAMQLNYLLDIADSEDVRFALTNSYCALSGIDLFSLSVRSNNGVDCTTARDFIDWLIELCIENAIPCSESLLNRAEDIGRYLYFCVAHKHCAICGAAPCEIHHSHERIGMGRDRKRIVHEEMEVQPLCRIHHNEAHTTEQKTFDEKYHLQSIKLDKRLCELLGLKQKAD